MASAPGCKKAAEAEKNGYPVRISVLFYRDT